MGAKHGTPEERFWRRVDQSDECWPWRGCVNHKGYGVLNVGHRNVLTHRFCYELTHGAIPEGMIVMHRCDRPSCCRPAHLLLGTPADNSADMVSKGRENHRYTEVMRAAMKRCLPNRAPLRGERHPNAKLSDGDVLEIRRAYAAREANQSQLAGRYGVTVASICSIVRGLGWRHLDGAEGANGADRRRNSPLSSTEVRELRARYAGGGMRQVALAAEYGITQTCVSNIVTRKSWADLP